MKGKHTANPRQRWLNALCAVAVAGVVGLYSFAAGQSAVSNSAEQLITVSEQLVGQWGRMSDAFDIPRSHTRIGALAPVVPAKFGALDLAVYSTPIVSPEYRDAFASAAIPGLISSLYIRAEEGALSYRIGGIRVTGLENLDDKAMAVIFLNMPRIVRDEVRATLSGRVGEFREIGVVKEGHLSAIVLPYPDVIAQTVRAASPGGSAPTG